MKEKIKKIMNRLREPYNIKYEEWPVPGEIVDMWDDQNGKWVKRRFRGIVFSWPDRFDEFPYIDDNNECWRRMRRI